MKKNLFLLLSFVIIANIAKSQLDSAIVFHSQPVIMPNSVNSIFVEAEPKISPDGQTLYFGRKNNKKNIGGRKDDSDIWFSTLDSTGNWTKAQNIGLPVNDKGYNTIVGIRNDGNALVITREYNEELKTELFITYFKNGNWTEPYPIIFQDVDKQFDDSYYTISSDFDVILISMNTEIEPIHQELFVSFLQDNGQWSKPKNVGTSLNTPKNEILPVLARDDKTMYFSSDGYQGYGDMDIFVTQRLDDTWMNWTKPRNLGIVINTIGYDGDFIVDAAGKYAYYSSDKEMPNDFDIYQIEIPQAAKPKPVVLLQVNIHNQTDKPLVNTKIDFFTLPKKRLIASTELSANNQFSISLKVGVKYYYEIINKGFRIKSDTIDLSKNDEYTEIQQEIVYVEMDKVEESIEPINVENDSVMVVFESEYVAKDNTNQQFKSDSIAQFDLDATETEQTDDIEDDSDQSESINDVRKRNLQIISISNVSFNFGKSNFSDEAKNSISNIIQVMNEHPSYFLVVEGHTDNVGSEKKNLEISIKRAKVVADYIIRKGIDKSRVSYEGYGEMRPITYNSSEEGKATNRRVDFRITRKY